VNPNPLIGYHHVIMCSRVTLYLAKQMSCVAKLCNFEVECNILNISLAEVNFYGSIALVGLGLHIGEVSRSHSDTLQSVGLFWASDRPLTVASIWQNTTLTTDRQPCLRRN